MNLRAVVAVGVTTIGFALALALRDRLDPWIATAAVGVVGIGLSTWALGPRTRALFAITGRSASLATCLGVVLVVATHALAHVGAAVAPELISEVRRLYASVAADYGTVPLVGLTLIVVLAEELVWRGAALELVPPRARWAGVVAILLYALPQALAGAWLLVAAALGLGAVFATQRLVSGRITDPFITHAVWSVSIFVLVPLV